MLSKKTEKIYLFIIRLGSYLILFLPLLVYRATLYPYIFGKIIGFRILVEIIFVVWLFLAVYDKKYRPNWKNPLVLTLTIFIGVLILTMFTGVDIQRSFWSTQERMTGVLTIIHFWLWFLILTSTFKEERDWKKLIWTSLICSFLVGLYGLGQKIGLKFLLKETDVRISATLGNPIYLGVYSMLHIFLAGFLTFWEKKRIWQFIAIIFLIFNLIIMSLTITRGVTVAFSLTIFLFLIFIVFILLSKQAKKIIIPIFILLIILAVAGLIFLQTPQAKFIYSKLPPVIARVFYFKNLTANADQRIIPWQIGLEGFKERPIFGWGWENYNVIFNKHFKPQIFKWGEGIRWFDRSHNQIIDLMALTGILGTLAYLLMYKIVFLILFKKYKSIQTKKQIKTNVNVNQWSNRRESISIVILVLIFLAYFIQNLTVFDTPAPLIVFYLALSLTYFITTNTNLPNLSAENRKQQLNKPQANQFPLPILIFLIIIFLPLAIYKFNLEPLQQSKAGITAYSLGQIDFKSSLVWFKKALAKPTFTNPEIRMLLAKEIDEQSKKTETSLFKQGLDFAISEMEKNTKEHPFDLRYWLHLGHLYNLGFNYGQAYPEKAEKTLEQALKLSPKRQEIYFELARAKMFLKKNQEAIELMEKAVALDDKVSESHFNLGLTYLFSGKLKSGLAEIEKAYALGYPIYQNPELNVFFAQNYAKDGQYNRAIVFIDASINAQPDNLKYLSQKIIIYHQAKNQEMVQKLLEELKKKDLNLATELEKYLKTLNP